MKNTAFTLIELLVVIVIIGILATVSTATFSGSREKADEAKILAEKSDACKETLAACTSLGNSDCQTFDECMASAGPTLFTVVTDMVGDPDFDTYAGNYYDSGVLGTGAGTYAIWTNGTRYAADSYLVFTSSLDNMYFFPNLTDAINANIGPYITSGGSVIDQNNGNMVVGSSSP